MLTFTSAEKVVNQLKGELGSYNDAGLIDDGMCYIHIVDAISELGLAACEELEETIHIENKQGKLPKYLKKIDEVWLLPDDCTKQKTPLYPHHFHKHSSHRYTPIHPFQVHPHPKYEHKPHTYKTAGNYLEVAVDTGDVLVKYQGIRVTDAIPTIPDDPLLIKYFVAYTKYRLFQNWYYDGVVQDIQQRYQEAKVDATTEELRAKSYVKLASFQSLLRIKLDAKYSNLTIWK